MSELLTIAMPKGRIFEEAAELLRQADFQLPPEFDDSRKLIVDIPEENMRFILAKPMDVTTYVEYGVADLGIAGKDVMLEEERDVYELLDLNISKCHLAVAGLPNAKNQKLLKSGNQISKCSIYLFQGARRASRDY